MVIAVLNFSRRSFCVIINCLGSMSLFLPKLSHILFFILYLYLMTAPKAMCIIPPIISEFIWLFPFCFLPLCLYHSTFDSLMRSASVFPLSYRRSSSSFDSPICCILFLYQILCSCYFYYQSSLFCSHLFFPPPICCSVWLVCSLWWRLHALHGQMFLVSPLFWAPAQI